MKKIVIVAILALLLPTTSSAALLAFSDRATWQAAAGGGTGDLFENFNSFTEDTFYGKQFGPVSAGFLTFDLVDTGDNDGSWLIDVPPDRYTSIPSVDGSPHAKTIGYEGSHTQADTILSFGNVIALGFDYKDGIYGDTDGILTTSLGDSIFLTNVASSDTFFLGLLYTEGEIFNSLVWAPAPGGIGYGIGIDNVEAFSAANLNPIPLPAAVWLFGTAIIGLVGFSRRNKST